MAIISDETMDAVVGPKDTKGEYGTKRAKKPQPVSAKLQARQDDYDGFLRTVEGKLRGGYHRPGSQNKHKR